MAEAVHHGADGQGREADRPGHARAAAQDGAPCQHHQGKDPGRQVQVPAIASMCGLSERNRKKEHATNSTGEAHMFLSTISNRLSRVSDTQLRPLN